jgi:Inositol monophosphatase family
MASSVDHKDHLEAAHLAGEAGRLLVRLRMGIGETMTADEARNRGDAESHEFLAQEISRLHPEDGLLSEEGKDDLTRLTRDRVWIIDPLDGTRESVNLLGTIGPFMSRLPIEVGRSSEPSRYPDLESSCRLPIRRMQTARMVLCD